MTLTTMSWPNYCDLTPLQSSAAWSLKAVASETTKDLRESWNQAEQDWIKPVRKALQKTVIILHSLLLSAYFAC